MQWIQEFLDHVGRLTVFNHIWSRLPPFLGFTRPNKAYPSVFQWQGKEMRNVLLLHSVGDPTLRQLKPDTRHLATRQYYVFGIWPTSIWLHNIRCIPWKLYNQWGITSRTFISTKRYSSAFEQQSPARPRQRSHPKTSVRNITDYWRRMNYVPLHPLNTESSKRSSYRRTRNWYMTLSWVGQTTTFQKCIWSRILWIK